MIVVISPSHISVFNELKLNNPILIGHSQGCLQILEYAHKYKNKINNKIPKVSKKDLEGKTIKSLQNSNEIFQ